MGIAGKRAVITGASSGIGQAMARTLADQAVSVALIGRDETRLGETRASLCPGARVICHTADLTSEQEAMRAVDRAAEELGGVDYLLNCAGVSQRQSYSLEAIETAEFHRIMQTNVDAVLFCTRQAMPYLRHSDGAHIITVLSTAAFGAGAGLGMYAASKHAALAFQRALTAECKGSRIRVSSISPGPVNTNIWSHKVEEVPQSRKENMLRPEDIADAALFLLQSHPNVHIDNITIEPWLYRR
jgi:NADP-dependent 3-hydroxy acid dehydrogenase YdfG